MVNILFISLGIVGISIWYYFLAYFSAHIHIWMGHHRRYTFFLDKLKKHEFKVKRILLMHIVLVLFYLVVWLIYQFSLDLSSIFFLVLGLFFIFVFIYTYFAIFMFVIKKKEKVDKVLGL